MRRTEEDPESADLFEREQVRNYIVFVGGSVRRHKRLVAAAVVWIMILAVAGLAAFPSTYHVEAKLLAQRNPVLAVRGDGPDATTPTRGAVEIIRRRDNLLALVEATQLVGHWTEHRAPTQEVMDAIRGIGRVETAQDRIDTMVERLEKRLAAWTNEGTVTIAIDWPDAQMASRLVDLAQQNFLEARYAQEITALAESLSILESHAEDLRADVDDAVAAVEDLRGSKAAKTDGAAAEEASPRAAPRARRAAAKPEVEQLRVAIAAKQRALDDLESFRRHRISEVQARLAEQRATYTGNHPIIIDLEQALSAASTPSPQVNALRQEIASLTTEYERTGGDARAAPIAAGGERRASARPLEVSPGLLRLEEQMQEDRDPASVYARGKLRDAMDKYAALRAQVHTAEIDLDTAQAAFKYRYNVLDPAKVPKRAASPNVPLVLLAAFLAALIGAVVIAVIVDIRNGKVLERWQIERLLDLPVLGEIDVLQLPRPGER